jgi:PrsW family intramembrane metalloprotease
MLDALIRPIAFTSAVVPSVIILIYFLVAARQHLDDELIWEGFGFGACAAFPAIAAAKLYEIFVGFGTDFYEMSVGKAFMGAAIPEEIFKFVALMCLCWHRVHELNSKKIFSMAIAVSCGFACFENIFYVVESDQWHVTAVTRMVTAVPGHAFVGTVMGFCIASARFGSIRACWWGLALLLPIILHGTYDFAILATVNLNEALPGTPNYDARTFVLLFILTVILEGLIAHLCLYAMRSGKRECERPHLKEQSKHALQWIQRFVESPILWGTLGMVALATAGAILDGLFAETEFVESVTGRAELAWRHGFAGFTVLHGAAFIGLAVILRKRHRSQHTP